MKRPGPETKYASRCAFQVSCSTFQVMQKPKSSTLKHETRNVKLSRETFGCDSVGLLQRIRWGLEEFGEAILIDRLVIGLFGGDPFLGEEILNGIIQRLHADVFAGLHL